MARNFRDHIDLNQLEIRQAVAHLLGADPGSPVEGQFWYHNPTDTFRFRAGSATIILGRLDQLSARSPSGSTTVSGARPSRSRRRSSSRTRSKNYS